MTDGYSVWEHFLIPLDDGRQLAARLWMPDGAHSSPVPAIFEYLPYRKRDGTCDRDEATYPGFAKVGYAGIRVDIAGHGESDGEFDDEYSEKELSDGLQVIQWISSQSWCDGNVGMMGISWGGFNGLQIAALGPAALKAVIAIGTTVDRYNDDIHYKNGCLLYSNFWWSSVMLGYASRPPDPELAGESWRKLWLHRLETQPFPLETWLAHQTRDDYWKHGSICENYENIKVPCLVISGWADGYINAPPACLENLASSVKAVNGPWLHKYPHFAFPHPRIDFLNEATQWWDKWLKGVENNVENLPDYRAFIMENTRPDKQRETDTGRWVAEERWPSANIKNRTLYLGSNSLDHEIGTTKSAITVCSPQDCGTQCGEFFPLKWDYELPGDQALDDNDSIVFDTPILEKDVEVLGRPVIKLEVSIDRPIGNLAIRLVDLHPDGVGHRVSWGVLNLSHRDGNTNPVPMIPGERSTVTINLDECGYRFIAGHRIRVSISTAYWPTIMPAPQIVTATIYTGSASYINLPVRPGGDCFRVAAPSDPAPLPSYPEIRASDYSRAINRYKSRTVIQIIDDTGETELPNHHLRVRQRHENIWEIQPNDPLSATMHAGFTCWMARGEWSIRTEATSSIRCDKYNYYLEAELNAYEKEECLHSRKWDCTIPRNWT